MVRGTWCYRVESRFLREIPGHLIEYEKGAPPLGAWEKAPSLLGGQRRLRSGADKPKSEARPPAAASRSRYRKAVPPPVAGSSSSAPAPGTRIRHEVFGEGVIVSVSASSIGHKAVIRFFKAGEKKVILEKARLDVLGS